MVFEAVLERSDPMRSLSRSFVVALALHALVFAISVVLPRRSPQLAHREEVYFTLWNPPVATSDPAPLPIGSDPSPPSALPAASPMHERASPPRAQAASLAARPSAIAPEPSSSSLARLPIEAARGGADDPSVTTPERGGTAPLVVPTATGAGAGALSATSASGIGRGSASAASDGQGARPAGAAVVMPFGEGMSRPVLLAKVEPTYTREALAARVEGSMLVKCVITSAGSLQGCRVVKGLPHMDEAVLRALSQWRYRPATYQGGPVTVDYVIPVRLVLP